MNKDALKRVELKNKIVSAILSYPPDTMSKAEFMADQILAALDLTEEWGPMETAPEGVAVQYFLPHSRTGYFDTQEVAMKMVSDADVSYWTGLGPNSGDDITEWIRQATHWRPLPDAPPPSTGGE